MKKTSLLIAALASLGTLRAAEPPATMSSYSITSDFTYSSEYIFRGMERAGNAFQPSVELTTSDFNLGLWTDEPITKHENDELDLYAGYDYHVNSAVKLEAVATYYWYPEAKPSLSQTKYSYEGGLGATYSIAGFSPNLYYYHDFRLHSDTVQGAVGYSLPLGVMDLSLDSNIFVGNVNLRDRMPDAFGPRSKDTYTYYGIDLSIPYKLSRTATFKIGGHYANVSNLAGVGGPLGTLGDNNLWFTAGVTIGF
jgi:uncharacterized protein (TIGR02001 family)